MSRIKWKYKNIKAFADGTGHIEEEYNGTHYSVEFDWNIKCLNDYEDGVDLDIDLDDINVYNSKRDSYDVINISEYQEELIEMITEYINGNLSSFGIDSIQDVEEYLNND